MTCVSFPLVLIFFLVGVAAGRVTRWLEDQAPSQQQPKTLAQRAVIPFHASACGWERIAPREGLCIFSCECCAEQYAMSADDFYEIQKCKAAGDVRVLCTPCMNLKCDTRCFRKKA